MKVQDNSVTPVSNRSQSLKCSGIILRSGVLVLMAFSSLSSVATNASESGLGEPLSSPEEGKRPVWLRPINENNSDSTPSGLIEDEIVELRPGWSQLEPSVLDVQAWDWLQQYLGRLVDEIGAPSRNRPSAKAFEANFVRATTEFLESDSEETDAFQIAVIQALEEIEQARARMLQGKSQAELDLDETAAMLASRARWVEYREAQRHAARHTLAVLQAQPRHELLREHMLKWLLRLAYGIGEVAK
jgi:hypothetical protein